MTIYKLFITFILIAVITACSQANNSLQDVPTETDQPVEQPISKNVDEAPTDQPVIQSVEVLMLESFPIQVNLMVQGLDYNNHCLMEDRWFEVTQQDDQFIVTRQSNLDPNKQCFVILEPFEAIVPLEVAGLPAGEYHVVADDVRTSFEFMIDNVLPEMDEPLLPTDHDTSEMFEIVPAPVESVEVVMQDETAQAIVQGSFPNGCYELADAEHALQGNQYHITLNAINDFYITCIQMIVPFEKTIPLTLMNQSSGIDTVVVNGVNTPFEASFYNEEATDKSTLPPTDATVEIGQWERVEFAEGGVSVAVLPVWTQTDKTWQVDVADPFSRLGVRWMATSLNWQPTDLLPPNSQITGRTTIELGWAEGLLYETKTLTTTERHLIAPLDGPMAYDFYLEAVQPETLTKLKPLHEQFAQSAQLFEPLFEPTGIEFTSPDGEYQLYYPEGFEVEVTNAQQTFFRGPQYNNQGEPTQLTLQILAEPTYQVDYQVILQERLRGLPGSTLVQTRDVMISGKPALMVEGLPERAGGARHLFVLHAGKLYTLIFWPLDDLSPQIMADMDHLWRTVLHSFTFQPL